MIVEIARYLSDCPYFEGENVLVNYLDRKKGSACVEQVDTLEMAREYADGGSLKRRGFKLSLRENIGVSAEMQRFSIIKCQRIEKWIEEQSERSNLPLIDGPEKLVEMKVVKPFRVVDSQGILARYEAEIEYIYYLN